VRTSGAAPIRYHSFKLRERLDLSKGDRSLLQGRDPELQTMGTEGQMLQRVMPISCYWVEGSLANSGPAFHKDFAHNSAIENERA
jgi:hypothetical protein